MHPLLKKIADISKPALRLSDIQKISPLKGQSLLVTLHRFVKRGDLIRIGKGLYRLPGRDVNVPKLACELGYPAYLSCEWALSYHGLRDQVPYQIDLMTTGRSKKITVEGQQIVYHHLKKERFKRYRVEDGLWISEPKKAMWDLKYLARRGIK